MQFDRPLVEGRLIERYKRFLFDAELEDGTIITGSCPNTGSMLGLTAPGSRIFMSENDAPTRKYRHMLEIVEADGTLVGINTGRPNRLTEEAIAAGLIGSLGDYAVMKREQKYGINSRIDILLEDPDKGSAYVEVKNVHYLAGDRHAGFPDSVTSRGAEHLDELSAMVEAGYRAVMVYLIQREDVDRLTICHALDPAYGAAFERAMARGVEACAVKCHISPQEIVASALVPVEEPGVYSVR